MGNYLHGPFTSGWYLVCPSLTVPNLLLNKHELMIQVCLGDHSWSFLVILAMTMTMTINLNIVLLVRVASAGQYECFEHVQIICVPNMNNFDSCLCTLKICSYRLCRTASHKKWKCYILVILTIFLVVLTVYYVIRTWQWDWAMTRRQCKIRQMEHALRKDFVILQLYWWLFSSTKHCSWNMV